MNKRPLVSIGVPVYNAEKSLLRALDSLTAQTYANIEIVISDNASQDGTQEICQKYAARDSRIRYHRNPANIGLHPNFCRVLELSAGEYFMWAAADDLRPPYVVEDCLQALLGNDRAVMAHGPVVLRSPGDELAEIKNAFPLTTHNSFRRVWTFTRRLEHRTMLYGLYRRSALDRMIYPTEGRDFGSDYHICLQMCVLGPIEYIEKPMITYQLRKTGNGRPHISSPVPAYLPLTAKNLFKPKTLRGITKRWSILVRGCFLLLKLRQSSLTSRVAASAAYFSSFMLSQGHKLARDIIFLLAWPGAWLLAQSRSLTQVRRFSAWLAHQKAGKS